MAAASAVVATFFSPRSLSQLDGPRQDAKRARFIGSFSTMAVRRCIAGGRFVGRM